jgi:DNA topoisomerase-3
MQNAWRFVEAPELRERLKEAKGIGTPATRAEIIKGLKRQNLLTADGKFVVPTSGGLKIFELLRQAAPGLVDPATTASWEMRLDDIVAGRGDFRSVIDGIAETAGRLIEILQGQSYSAVDLGVAKPATPHAKRRSAGKVRPVKPTASIASGKQPARRRRSSRQIRPTASTSDPPLADKDAFRSGGGAPTAKMVSYAKRLAGSKNVPLPPRLEQDFQICRCFLDQYSR